MRDRRKEKRLMCAELVEVEWTDKFGDRKRSIANLEDISLSGACVQLELPIPRETYLTVRYGDGVLVGAVRHCLYRDLGYFVGIEFAEGCRWSKQHFKPEHLLDVDEMMKQAEQRLDAC